MRSAIRLFLVVIGVLSCINAYAIQVKVPKRTLPKCLHVGDTVGLISSGFTVDDPKQIPKAISHLESLGLKVKVGQSVYKTSGYFAGTDQDRANDINSMFANKEVKAIFELRGGWGSARTLPYLDYDMIRANPKIFMGLSDITSLLVAIQSNTGLVTYHGPVEIETWSDDTTVNFYRTLFFNNPQPLVPEQYHKSFHVISPGVAEGELIGGNLSTLTALLGTPYQPNFKGKILFVEDVNEPYYRIDRMMSQLQLSGVLKQIKGFVFGQCTNCYADSDPPSPDTFNLQQILSHYIKPLHIPAWSGAMFGHSDDNLILPEGSFVRINANSGEIRVLSKICEP